MELFWQLVLSFPTVIFSVLLVLALAYWLLAMTGLVDLDLFDGAMVPDTEALELGGLAGFLMKFGLDGVPLTLILSVVTLFAWLLIYFTSYLFLQHLPWDALRYGLGSLAMVLSVIVALPFAGLALRPLRQLFARLKPVDAVSLLSEVAIVRSPVVSLTQGSASLDDGGAGLILHVRAEPGQFVRGDRVVLVEYIESQNAYRVIAESAGQPPP